MLDALLTTADRPSADAAARIRAAGLRVTRARLRVLSLLEMASSPLSHAQIEAQLALDEEGALDRVTLYRVLDALAQCGLLLKALDARGVFRFAVTAQRHSHDDHLHFRCLDCGGVFCLDAAPPQPPSLPSGFRLLDAAYDLRGACPDCASVVSSEAKRQK